MAQKRGPLRGRLPEPVSPIKLTQTHQNPVPNSQSLRPGHLGTGFWSVRMSSPAKTGPEPAPEARPKYRKHYRALRRESTILYLVFVALRPVSGPSWPGDMSQRARLRTCCGASRGGRLDGYKNIYFHKVWGPSPGPESTPQGPGTRSPEQFPNDSQIDTKSKNDQYK